MFIAQPFLIIFASLQLSIELSLSRLSLTEDDMKFTEDNYFETVCSFCISIAYRGIQKNKNKGRK